MDKPLAQKPLSALFVGLGSIGRRHLADLRALCAERQLPLFVTALRATENPLPPETGALVDRELPMLPEGERFDMAFITGPTQLHAAAVAGLKGRVGSFFIEKPIFEGVDHDLEALGLGPGQKAYVAAPLRWTALYPALKAALKTHRPYSARVICSSYLPDWRPGVDYRTVYSAKKALGGGVSLDLIHEWDYLADLFGLPGQVFNLRGRFSELEIDSDDLSVYIARYPGLLCELHLDYFGRTYRRAAEFFCAGGTLTADFGAGTLTLPDGTVEPYAEAAYQGHRRELAWFLGYALGEEPESLNPPAHAFEVLKVALGNQSLPGVL
ncbi:Gfo/Idh/MocA family oxidoreductase [Ruminococcaceae bacterium OttesenSCG-928-D13]|nr:Gfo/Idh/MocA family oxidoreductase [Ruminococcaceae bacterium OttesenSCG-928-D13]